MVTNPRDLWTGTLLLIGTLNCAHVDASEPTDASSPEPAGLDAAINAARRGELEQARTLAQKATQQNPALEKAYLLWASICAMQNRSVCESNAYQAGLNALPESLAIQREQAVFWVQHHQLTKGLELLQKITKPDQNPSPDLIADLAFAYQAAGHINEARNAVNRSLGRAPQCLTCLLISGEIAFSERNYELAEKHFLLAARLEPNNLNAQHNLAKVIYQQQRYKEAAILFQKLASQYPKSIKTKILAAESLIKAQMPEKALVYVNDALVLAPNHPKILSLLKETKEKIDSSSP